MKTYSIVWIVTSQVLDLDYWEFGTGLSGEAIREALCDVSLVAVSLRERCWSRGGRRLYLPITRAPGCGRLFVFNAAGAACLSGGPCCSTILVRLRV